MHHEDMPDLIFWLHWLREETLVWPYWIALTRPERHREGP